MVEAVIGASALVLLFGCLSFMHGYAKHQLLALDRVRQRVWTQAMQGCGSAELKAESFAREMQHGDIPTPDAIFPSELDDTERFSIRGLFGAGSVSGSKGLRIVCNPWPSRSKPTSDPIGWVTDLFH